MEVTIQVKKVAEAVSEKGTTYQEITDDKGKIHRNFDDKKDEWVRQHLGKFITLVKEKGAEIKGGKGNYWNIVDMKEFTGETKADSPDYDIAKNASIEAQVAIYEIGASWRAGKLQDDDNLVTLHRGWCESKLSTESPPVASTKPLAGLKASSPSRNEESKRAEFRTAFADDLIEEAHEVVDPLADKAPTSRLATQPATEPQKNRITELMKARPGRAPQLIKEWGWTVKTPGELTRDQMKHLIEVMEKEIETSGEPFL